MQLQVITYFTDTVYSQIHSIRIYIPNTSWIDI